MADVNSTGRKLRFFLLYLLAGAAIFAIAATWIFTGLRLWGN